MRDEGDVIADGWGAYPARMRQMQAENRARADLLKAMYEGPKPLTRWQIIVRVFFALVVFYVLLTAALVVTYA